MACRKDACSTSDVSNGIELFPIPVVNDIDLEEVNSFQYVKDKIVHKCMLENMKTIFIGCACEAECDTDSCYCLLEDGKNYDENCRLLKHTKDEGGLSIPIFECNTCCECHMNCGNRIVQNGLQYPLEVFKTSVKGWAVRALCDIKRNSFIAIYAGEVVSREEVLDRKRKQSSDQINFIAVGKECRGDQQTTTYIDASRIGNVARFFNHSCDPNLKLHPVRSDSSIPDFAFFSSTDIQKWDELTFDYGGREEIQDNAETISIAQKSQNGNIQRGGVCHCKTISCRGFLPYDPSLF